MQKKGFTLIEILTVVVIISLVVTMSIPTYKKSRAASLYETAKGQLAQLGTAVQALQRDLLREDIQNGFPSLPNTSYRTQFLKDWHDAGLTANVNTAPETLIECRSLGTHPERNECYTKVLFARGYLHELVFDGTGDRPDMLHNYSFYLCHPDGTGMTPTGGAWRNEYGCKKREANASNGFVTPQPVVSMQLTTEAANPSANDGDIKAYERAQRLPFFRAVFLTDGTIERQSFDQARESEINTSSVPSNPGPLD